MRTSWCRVWLIWHFSWNYKLSTNWRVSWKLHFAIADSAVMTTSDTACFSEFHYIEIKFVAKCYPYEVKVTHISTGQAVILMQPALVIHWKNQKINIANCHRLILRPYFANIFVDSPADWQSDFSLFRPLKVFALIYSITTSPSPFFSLFAGIRPKEIKTWPVFYLAYSPTLEDIYEEEVNNSAPWRGWH